MQGLCGAGYRWGMLLAAVVVLAGCSSSQPRKAPVEDRGTAVGQPTQPSTPVAAPRPAAPAEAPQRPGYYTIKPGDTLIRIGLDTGQNWRDIARWNNIDNPNLIEVGQVLRVAGNVPMPVQPTVAAADPPGHLVGHCPVYRRKCCCTRCTGCRFGCSPCRGCFGARAHCTCTGGGCSCFRWRG